MGERASFAAWMEAKGSFIVARNEVQVPFFWCARRVARFFQALQNFPVTGAFRPDGLVFTRPCKIFQAKVFQEKKLKDKRIHDNLILLRVTFSIIVLESLRKIARWVVFAAISCFCKLANTTPSHPLF